MENLISFLNHYVTFLSFYLPLGIIGIWRWTVWAGKKVIATRYEPKKGEYKASVSIVTPVYNEDPLVFRKALISWRKSNPSEIIAVIDYTDKENIELFKKFQKVFKRAKLIITKIPGKREALADGIKEAKGKIVALVDSDTIWEEGVLEKSLPPFKDPKVAGVATRQSVYETSTLAQKLFDILLDSRYFDEFPFLAASGDALVCLSGRTAFYKREAILPLLSDLINETFAGKKAISGDDKRLTYLVLAKGYKVAFQQNALVKTPGMKDLKPYIQQRLRWTRNSLRADLKAISEGWVVKHPALLFYQIDKVLQSFTTILSPIYFAVSLFLGLYLGAFIILVWWTVSRAIKIYPHLKRKPQDIAILPQYILFTFMMAFLKLYALFTLNTQSWITRWDKSRLPQIKFLNYAPAYGLTAISLFLLTSFVYSTKEGVINLNPVKPTLQAESENPSIVKVAGLKLSGEEKIKGVTESVGESGELVTNYEVQGGDSISTIAYKFDIDLEDLISANAQILPNSGLIEPGLVLNIPYQDLKINHPKPINNRIKNLPPLIVDKNKKSNKIILTGRGQIVTLSQIAEQAGTDALEQVGDKEWILRYNLHVQNGVTLKLNKSEVKWLKLASNKNGFIWIRSSGGVISIDGVKITSWDEAKKDYDKNYKDGRAFIMAKYAGRMDIKDSELAYLGYFPTSSESASSYGVSWKIPDGSHGKYLMSGTVTNSKFHHNYFGSYTYGATGMVFKGNEFYSNVQYGLDPHDDSNGFLVEGNKAYENGNHGIIFSKRCINNVVKNNLSYNNKLHGIMLDRSSNNNIVEGNTVYGNRDGIALYDSKNNIIRNNKILKNERGLRANTSSSANLITGNKISDNSQYGVYLYGQANGNVVSTNLVSGNNNGLYIKTNDNEIVSNQITDNRVGIFFLENATNNKVVDNNISGNSKFGVYSKLKKGAKNFIDSNNLTDNGADLYSQSPDANLLGSR